MFDIMHSMSAASDKIQYVNFNKLLNILIAGREGGGCRTHTPGIGVYKHRSHFSEENWRDMTKDRLERLLERHGSLRWEGVCHDCGRDVHMTADPCDGGIEVSGGAVYEPEPEKFFLKCDACYLKDSVLRDWRECEVYSRIVGYLRPVRNWNPAKRQEFRDRKTFCGVWMPFKSKKQRTWLRKNKPGAYKKWKKKYGTRIRRKK